MSADTEPAIAAVAAAIAEPARARMLSCLMDGHARTSTELAVVGQVSASTASAHLGKLVERRLVDVVAQGRHRYYRLASASVGSALEALMVVAGDPAPRFAPTTPPALRHARSCYDHLAGTLGVRLHDRCLAAGWLAPDGAEYHVTAEGETALGALGVDVAGTRRLRRRFACPCLDWSERRPHLGGALGAAVLATLLRKDWLTREFDGRALRLTPRGQRALRGDWGIAPDAAPTTHAA